VLVHARLRYTSLLILPKEEQILDYVCGDKEFWVVNRSQNFAYVKPAKAGARVRGFRLRPKRAMRHEASPLARAAPRLLNASAWFRLKLDGQVRTWL
jgi:hypothetical protein